MVETTARAHIEIDGRVFVLGGDRDLHEVMAHIERAAASPPAFVHLADGDEMVAVLIHSHTSVIVTLGRDSAELASTEGWETFREWEL